MSLREEIKPYRDANDLVAPARVNGQTESDNGPMFESEYFILLSLTGELTYADWVEYQSRMARVLRDGLLFRRPNIEFGGQEGPDDYHGVLAACSLVGLTNIGGQILNYGLKHFGWYNNDRPGTIYRDNGKINWQAFQWRMPQLISLSYAAARKMSLLNPILWVSNIITAAIIATSCWRVPTDNSDARRLAWLLIIGMREQSWLCRQASKIWYKRLYRDYGPGGMKEVAKIYYQDNHPFHRYWVDK